MHLAATVLVMLIWHMDILHDASAEVRYFRATREEGHIPLSPMMSLRFGLLMRSNASRIFYSMPLHPSNRCGSIRTEKESSSPVPLESGPPA